MITQLFQGSLEYPRDALVYSSRTAKHFAQFYEDESILLGTLVFLLKRSLEAKQGVIVVATDDHLKGIMDRLRSADIDLAALLARKQIVFCDARKTLDSFMVDGLPCREDFMEHVGKLVTSMASLHGDVFAFGEMVNILWQEGLQRATIELELLWNELIASLPITLLCGYDIRSFSAAECTTGFGAICSCHGKVYPSSYLGL